MQLMRSLVCAFLVSLGCSNEKPTDADPCERAASNARRLVKENVAAKARFGEDPFPIERCRAQRVTAADMHCIGYASSWAELETCSGSVLSPRTGVAEE
ncbi:MAG: hypothetical protein H0T65_12620 [Deltaproteobacteria bacterium]|nr:hypothetical protein [Deltaproteobacteria bacterium]